MYGETCNHSGVSESWGGRRWPLSRVSMEEGGQGDAQVALTQDLIQT